jgi:hypothetical protein
MKRRNFLKVVTSVSISQTLLLTLKTSALDRRLVVSGDRVEFTGDESNGQGSFSSEKVTVSNNGATLIIDVEGRPGRCTLLLYKLVNAKGKERIFIHKDARIPAAGHLTFVVDMTGSLNADIPFMIVTSAQSTYDVGNFGTDWFIVRINSSRPSESVFPQSLQTDPTGEHQKVIRYGITDVVAKRVFAPLKTNRPD